MLARGLITLSVLSMLWGVARGGDNFIKEWSGAGGGYSIDQGDRRVTITAPGTYKFEGLEVDHNDPNTVLGLGVIDHITLDANCPSGTVNVYVLRNPNEGGGPGALGVGEIDLKLAGVTGNIMDVSTTVNLAYLDMIQADTISGDIETVDIEDDIQVDYFGGGITCDHMHGLHAECGTTGLPYLWIKGAWGDAGADEIYVPGPFDWLDLEGAASGTVKIGDVQTVWLFGELSASGDLTVGDLQYLEVIGGAEWLGSITVTGYLDEAVINRVLAGALHLQGGFGTVIAWFSIAGEVTVEHDMAGIPVCC